MRLIKACFTFVLLAFQGIAALSQTVPADLADSLNQTLNAMQGQTGTTSLSAAMQFADGSIWADAKGISSLSPFEKVTPDHKYLIGSVTKTITSACILQMADEGLLGLDDGIYAWLDTIPYVSPNITIRHLLQHTSGIYDVLNNSVLNDSMGMDIGRIWTAQEIIDKFMKPALFQPGASWSYSNSNYFLLGLIIEKISGNPFYAELRNRFFAPQGLGSFSIPAFESIQSPIAHVWIDLDADDVQDDAHWFYMSYLALNSVAGAAGGYFSTPTDCTKWMHKYMRGDLLSPAMMAAAKTTVFAPGSQGDLYGLGLMKNNFLGNVAYGHGGDLAYHASSWYFPEKDISITVFNNDNDKTSWDLLPVVRELLRTCENYEPISAIRPDKSQQLASLVASPNPFDYHIAVTLDLLENATDAALILTDAMGKRLSRTAISQPFAGRQTVNLQGLQDLPAGFYYLTVILDGQPTAVAKLVK